MSKKFKQVREPNLDPYLYEGGKLITNWVGWCLAYVRTAFDSAWAGPWALDSWQTKTSFKHADRDFPTGVKIPIWFRGYIRYSAEYKRNIEYGHAAILQKFADGTMKIWSTPLSAGVYAATWATIEQVENKYGVTYVGWSEDVGGTRVVEVDNAPAEVPLKDTQRVVTNTDGLNARSQPTTASTILKTFEKGDILNLDYAVKSQDPYGNGYEYWGHGAISGVWVWLGGTNDPTPGRLPVRDYFPPNPNPPAETPPTTVVEVFPAPSNDPAVKAVYNKKHPIGESYAPADLTDVGSGQWLRKEAADALALMKAAASKAGPNLIPQSGYRSFATQKQVYDGYVKKDGQAKADTYSARPGYSEHQTGLALDFAPIDDIFKSSAEYAWLVANAHKYGWVLRYPENATAVTGYMYEPWHWRYVGVAAAADMFSKNIATLEQHYNVTGGSYPEQEKPADPAPDKPAPVPAPPSEAATSATKFVTRIVTQLAAAKIIVDGVLAALEPYIHLTLDANLQGWLTVLLAVGIIFYGQFAYKLDAKFKWPF